MPSRSGVLDRIWLRTPQPVILAGSPGPRPPGVGERRPRRRPVRAGRGQGRVRKARRAVIDSLSKDGPSARPLSTRRSTLSVHLVRGVFIPFFAAPNLARSVHTLSGFSGVLLIALGLVWPRLDLGAAASRAAFWLLIYSDLAIIAAFVLGAVWSAGGMTMPTAAGEARGSAFQETTIAVVAYSSGPTGIAAFALIL